MATARRADAVGRSAPFVTLTLSQEEVEALWDVCWAIGGEANTSRRGVFSGTPESIKSVLSPFLVGYKHRSFDGGIYF